jgi:hypothetical protein
MAALDSDSQVSDVDVRTQADNIKEKLEVLLGAKPDAPVDETVKETASLAVSTDRLAEAGSTFLRAALDIVAELAGGRDADDRLVFASEVRAGLDVKVVLDERGQRRLSVAMPTRSALAGLLRGLAGLLSGGHDGREPQPLRPGSESNGSQLRVTAPN